MTGFDETVPPADDPDADETAADHISVNDSAPVTEPSGWDDAEDLGEMKPEHDSATPSTGLEPEPDEPGGEN